MKDLIRTMQCFLQGTGESRYAIGGGGENTWGEVDRGAGRVILSSSCGVCETRMTVPLLRSIICWQLK